MRKLDFNDPETMLALTDRQARKLADSDDLAEFESEAYAAMDTFTMRIALNARGEFS